MIQVGISAFYHDSAVCVLKDGKVIVAAEEERFTGLKHDSSFPEKALQWCLYEANIIDLNEVDEVCWYENPSIKKDRVIKIFNKRPFKTFFNRIKFLKSFKKEKNPEYIIRKKWGYNGKITFVDHHLSHAAFSYLTSPYKNAAILTVDGVGEWETVTISKGDGENIEKKLSINFPNSLGMLYSTLTAYLGFKPNEGEYKVMGLAPYGNPGVYLNKLKTIFSHTDKKFKINQKYFTWEYDDRIMFNKRFCNLLGIAPRLPEEPLLQEHKDLAAACQKLYEIQFLRLVRDAFLLCDSKNLVLGGGCAYNGVANSKAYRYFRSIHIPFHPSDAGSAIGACLLKYKGPRKDNTSPYLGPKFHDYEITRTIETYGNKIKSYNLSDKELIKKTASLINSGNVIGWFQGRMEFGSRALGNRSILASPLIPNMKAKLNEVIKKREGFRPFAPSCIEKDAYKLFNIKEPIPYMNQVVTVKDGVRPMPAITHIDGSARVQTVNKKQNSKYYLLLQELKRISGIGVTLNTSFNFKDQTITMIPKEAIDRFLDCEMDYLIIENYLIEKV